MITIELKHGKATKNKDVFESVDGPIQALYIDKDAITKGKPPKVIKVTIEVIEQ